MQNVGIRQPQLVQCNMVATPQLTTFQQRLLLEAADCTSRVYIGDGGKLRLVHQQDRLALDETATCPSMWLMKLALLLLKQDILTQLAFVPVGG